MLTGPFDGRKKRSRCEACIASHLKCSGQEPCTNCERRKQVCVLGQARNGSPMILIGRGKQVTLSDWAIQSNKGQRKRSLPDSSAASTIVGRLLPLGKLIADDELCYLSYFDVFARSNSFNGKKRTLNDEVRKYALYHSGKYLMDAMLALGVLQAVKLEAQDIPISARRARTLSLEYYSKSIVGLRVAIDKQERNMNGKVGCEIFHATVLWSTLFLGLFELMCESTGEGWSKHMVHGTTRALEACGPSSCRSGPGRGFFIQARVFEVSRTILFNETSFLTQPAWMSLSREIWNRENAADGGEKGDYEWSPLDSLLDIMVMCSQLSHDVKTKREAIIELDADGQPSVEARAACTDGHALRKALSDWYASYGSTAEADNDEDDDASEDASMLLSRIFFAAISIYLSGIFDYGMSCWNRLELRPSTLTGETVQAHAATILRLTAGALDGRSSAGTGTGIGSSSSQYSNCRLSPLLFLFPLRIAGARVRTAWQRGEVARLVGRIAGVGFAAAAAVQDDLEEVWGILATDRQALEY